MRKYFFTPPQEEGQREKSREDGSKRKAAVNRGEVREGGEGGGSAEMLTHSHAGLSGLFPLPTAGPKNRNVPRVSPFPTLDLLGRLIILI